MTLPKETKAEKNWNRFVEELAAHEKRVVQLTAKYSNPSKELQLIGKRAESRSLFYNSIADLLRFKPKRCPKCDSNDVVSV